jgi:N-acetylmuramoyl-L-alanine amidase
MRVCIIPKRFFLLAVFPLIALTCVTFWELLAAETLVGKIIVVDAGHGGIDPGANRPGVLEKDINLAIALQMRDILQSHGAKVVLTRDTDIELSGQCDNEKVRGRYRRDLNARLEAIQESDADLFVSIHANANSNPNRRGIECFYAPKSEAGRALALSIQEQLRLIAPIEQEAEPAAFFVLRRNKVPAVLVEVGFITNPEERVLLQSPEYRRKIAEGIVAGIASYYQSTASARAKTAQ